jgi:hypothetical protein
MDFFDIFSVFPPSLPGSASRRSPREDLAGAFGLMLFPMLDFFIVLFAELYKHPTVAGVVLPVGFGATSVLLCRLLRISTGWTLVVSLGCVALCLVGSMSALLLGVFMSIFSTF